MCGPAGPAGSPGPDSRSLTQGPARRLVGKEAVTTCTQALVLLTHAGTPVCSWATRARNTLKAQGPAEGTRGRRPLQATAPVTPSARPRGTASSEQPVGLSSWPGARLLQAAGP